MFNKWELKGVMPKLLLKVKEKIIFYGVGKACFLKLKILYGAIIMGKIIQFPLDKKLQKDEFLSAISDLNYPEELKEQLKLEVWPYIDKHSKISVSNLKMEIPNSISYDDEKHIVSQVQELLFTQIKFEKDKMLKEIIKLAAENSKLKFMAENTDKHN